MDGYGPSTFGDRIAEVDDSWYGSRLLSGLELEERVPWYDRPPFDARATRHVTVYRRL